MLSFAVGGPYHQVVGSKQPSVMCGGYYMAKATTCNPFLTLEVLLGGIRCLIEAFTLFRFLYICIYFRLLICFCKWLLLLILLPLIPSLTLFSHPFLCLNLLLSPLSVHNSISYFPFIQRWSPTLWTTSLVGT